MKIWARIHWEYGSWIRSNNYALLPVEKHKGEVISRSKNPMAIDLWETFITIDKDENLLFLGMNKTWCTNYENGSGTKELKKNSKSIQKIVFVFYMYI